MVGPTQNNPARLAGSFGRGAEAIGGSRGNDGASISSSEFGKANSRFTGLGGATYFFDVDGDG